MHRRRGSEPEIRAFFPEDGATVEDPVTGSLNASLAARVHISCDSDGAIWVGGGTVTCITGHVDR